MDRRTFLTKSWWGLMLTLLFGKDLAWKLLKGHEDQMSALPDPQTRMLVDIHPGNHGVEANAFTHAQYGKSIRLTTTEVTDTIAEAQSAMSKMWAEEIDKQVMENLWPRVYQYQLGREKMVGLNGDVELPALVTEQGEDSITIKTIQDAKVVLREAEARAKSRGGHADVVIYDDPIAYPETWDPKVIKETMEEARKYEKNLALFSAAIMNKPKG